LSETLSGENSYIQPQPHRVFLFTLCCSALFFALLARLRKLFYRVESRGGLVQCSLDFFKALPFVRTLLKKEMVEMEKRLRGSLPARPPSLPQRLSLPAKGTKAEEVLAALVEAARGDGDGAGKLSGALYLPKEAGDDLDDDDDDDDDEFVVVEGSKKKEKEEEKKKEETKKATKNVSSAPPPPLTHSSLLNAAYAAFAHTNPMVSKRKRGKKGERETRRERKKDASFRSTSLRKKKNPENLLFQKKKNSLSALVRLPRRGLPRERRRIHDREHPPREHHHPRKQR
jgi:hypothetical protein